MANSINVNGCSVASRGKRTIRALRPKSAGNRSKDGNTTTARRAASFSPASGHPSIAAVQSGIYGSLKSSRIMATKKATKTYEVEVSMTWSQSYTVKAKTAAEARRKAWEKFKRHPPKSCFTLMEDRIDE